MIRYHHRSLKNMSSLLRLFIWMYTIHVQCMTSHWLNLTPLLSPDSSMAVGSYNGSIYLIGGFSGDFNHVTKYSIALDTFSAIEPTPLTSPLFAFGQFYTQQNDIVYMSFQTNPATSPSAFDLSTLTYTQPFTSLPSDPGLYRCVASFMDYLYVTGGHGTRAGGSKQNKSLQVMQISTGQWKESPNRMNTGRKMHSCIVHQSWLYVFGGYGSLKSTERVGTNQIISKIWKNSVTLKEGVRYSRAVSCGDKLFVLGGYSAGVPMNTAQLIDPLLKTVSVQTMPYALVHMGTICVEQDIYVFGGSTGDNVNHVFYYTEFTENPTSDTQDPTESSTTLTHHPTSITLLPSVTPSELPSQTPSEFPSQTPSELPSQTPSEVASHTLSDNPTIAIVSVIVPALIVILIYILRRFYLKQKQKWIEEGLKSNEAEQVVVMAVNQNKSNPQVAQPGSDEIMNKLDKQEDDISDDEEDSNDSLSKIQTQNDDEQAEGVQVGPVEIIEGNVKNETELRQEEKSSSCNSDDIYQGNENSVSN
eukprot:175240_1